MSFWNLNDGSTAEGKTDYEMDGGKFEPIPNNTTCLAVIEEAKWDHYEEDRFISLKWRIAKPEEYAKRVVFHKVKVFGTSKCKDPDSTADKAKRMLAAIDANAGGKLMALGKEPTDMDLMKSLAGKMMAIKLMVWEMEIGGEKKDGNWVSAVSPAKASAEKQTPPPASDPMSDDIPW